eukprot:3850884-Pyramimonas_sp.AAC.1
MAAQKPPMRHEREKMAFAMPKFALDALGKITSISRASPKRVIVARFSVSDYQRPASGASIASPLLPLEW